MSDPLEVEHTHQPIYRVVRASWSDPLDVIFSRRKSDNRWNTDAFGALYCCCSIGVARAVARDVFRLSAVEPADLQPAYQPRLAELRWTGRLIDVASAEGVTAAGFPAAYPEGVAKTATREMAVHWYESGKEGVLCRSASLVRFSFADWTGPHPRWGELALFLDNCARRPEKGFYHGDLRWLSFPTPPSAS